MSEAWCVVNTLPHQEARAEANLLRQDFRAWLPVMERSRRHARRIDTIRVPVFPGYLFVALDLEAGAWGKINNSFGVRRLLCNGTRPEILPEGFVSALRQMVGAAGTCAVTPTDLEPGTKVRVASGPFVNCLAIVSSLAPGDRVKLLLEVLGGRVAATMPRRALTLTA
jgi:transcriptional antiterminator RfaH